MANENDTPPPTTGPSAEPEASPERAEAAEGGDSTPGQADSQDAGEAGAQELDVTDFAPGREPDVSRPAGESPEETRTASDLEAAHDIPVEISAVLGRATLQVSQLLRLGRGAVVELDRKVGEAIDIYVNNRLIARGELVVVEDRLGVTMTEIVKGGH